MTITKEGGMSSKGAFKAAEPQRASYAAEKASEAAGRNSKAAERTSEVTGSRCGPL